VPCAIILPADFYLSSERSPQARIRRQFERLYERVRNESRGSFQNLALQPLIRALLLPIGGFSGIEILQHVVLGK